MSQKQRLTEEINFDPLRILDNWMSTDNVKKST